MNEKTGSYQIVDFPPDRRFMARFLDFETGKHNMYALLEVDVTRARQFIEETKARTGEGLSFTGYLTGCLGRAVSDYKEVQSYRKGRKELVLFDDVDVGLMIEQEIGGKRRLTGHVVRCANRKTFLEIHKEIRAVQSNQSPPSAAQFGWFQS